MTLILRMQPADFDECVDMGLAMQKESKHYSRFTPKVSKSDELFNAISDGNENVLALVSREKDQISGMFIGVLSSIPFCAEFVATDVIFYVKPEFRGTMASIKMIKEFAKWGMSGRNPFTKRWDLNVSVVFIQCICEVDMCGGSAKKFLSAVDPFGIIPATKKLLSPDMPTLPAGPAPSRSDQEIQQAASRARQEVRNRRGRASTILTQDEQNTGTMVARKRLTGE